MQVEKPGPELQAGPAPTAPPLDPPPPPSPLCGEALLHAATDMVLAWCGMLGKGTLGRTAAAVRCSGVGLAAAVLLCSCARGAALLLARGGAILLDDIVTMPSVGRGAWHSRAPSLPCAEGGTGRLGAARRLAAPCAACLEKWRSLHALTWSSLLPNHSLAFVATPCRHHPPLCATPSPPACSWRAAAARWAALPCWACGRPRAASPGGRAIGQVRQPRKLPTPLPLVLLAGNPAVQRQRHHRAQCLILPWETRTVGRWQQLQRCRPQGRRIKSCITASLPLLRRTRGTSLSATGRRALVPQRWRRSSSGSESERPSWPRWPRICFGARRARGTRRTRQVGRAGQGTPEFWSVHVSRALWSGVELVRKCRGW